MDLIIIIVTFLGFTALVAFISWYRTKDDKLDTQDGYYLAGHNLIGMVIAGSLLMTNLSAEQLVGNNGQSVRVGMSTMGWEVTSAIALCFLAFILMPRYLKTGLTTVPEFFEIRYDKFARRLVSFIVLFSYVVIMLPNILYAGAQVFCQVFQIQKLTGLSDFWAYAILGALIALVGSIYALCGGLHAVALSDSINGIGLIIGGLSVPVFGLIALGQKYGGGLSVGIEKFITLDPVRLNALNPAHLNEPYLPWPLLLTGMVVNNLYYWSTNQSIIQRTFGARNLKEAQKGAIYASFMKIFTPLIIVVPGIIAFFLYGEEAQATNGDVAYAMLVARTMPTWILGFFAAVMFGAILSSFNSVLNSASTIYALDIHRPIFNPDCSDSHCVKVGQIFGTIIAVASVIIAPFMLYMGGITSFVNSAFAAFNTPIFVCLAVGFLSKKASAVLPKVIIPVHVVLYCILQFWARYHIAALVNVHYLYFTAALFIVDMIIVLIVNKVAPRPEDYILADHAAVELVPWKRGKIVAAIAIIVMIIAYIVCSPLGIAASGYVTY